MQRMHAPAEDAQAVAAVRAGDKERYRELVQRHERRVFAVAWSRLGDASLAEEATQEAFIRGYQRLWLLGDGRKFAGWIAAIARNAAISLGIRHRRELKKRERWALDLSETAPEEELDVCTAETLRHTLEQLPAAHRECLALFYIEGKSGTEAAAALGISESAFRVRLHRARAVLREELEAKLAGSLEKLRPPESRVSAVMAVVAAAPGVKAAGGGGAAVAATLAKLLPFKMLIPLFSMVTALPMVLLGWFHTRLEVKNFRDPNGFRARLFKRGVLWRTAGILLLMVTLWWSMPFILQYGLRPFYVVLGLFSLGNGLAMARRLAINRNEYFVSSVAGTFVLALASLAVGLRFIPPSLIMLAVVVHPVLLALFFGKRPIRMDYNLFLRAAEGMVPHSEAVIPSPKRLNKADQLAFARFLGTRWLVTNYRWRDDELALALSPIRSSVLGLFEFWKPWSRSSQAVLTPEGSVQASLIGKEYKVLRELVVHDLDQTELERAVAGALDQAWQDFRTGDLASAQRALGQTPDTEVFNVPPMRSRAALLNRWSVAVMLVLLLPMLVLDYCKPPWFSGLKPVDVTEAEVRAALANYESTRAQSNSLSRSLAYAVIFSYVLPETNLIKPGTLRAIQADALKAFGFPFDGELPIRCERLADGMLPKAVEAGWLRLQELNIVPSEFEGFLRNRADTNWKFLMSHRKSSTGESDFTVEQFDSIALARLRLINRTIPLDAPTRERIIAHVASFQVLSGKTPADRPLVHNWRDLRGLFVSPGWPVLQDTYCDLAALEVVGGLDRIDREACVSAILGLHKGRGFFVAPETEENWKLRIAGDAVDTFCAFEALRMLNALDRLTDLDRWQFRPSHRSKRESSGRAVTWDEIEAWLCQERVQKFARDRKENPNVAAPSLLRNRREL